MCRPFGRLAPEFPGGGRPFGSDHVAVSRHSRPSVASPSWTAPLWKAGTTCLRRPDRGRENVLCCTLLATGNFAADENMLADTDTRRQTKKGGKLTALF